MNFDTILCNPPYNNAHNRPIYQEFMEALAPRAESSCWIIPSSWIGNANWSVSKSVRESMIQNGAHTVVKNQNDVFKKADVRTTTLIFNRAHSSEVTFRERESGKEMLLDKRTVLNDKVLLCFSKEELALINRIKSGKKIYVFDQNPETWKIGVYNINRTPKLCTLGDPLRLIDPNEFDVKHTVKYFNLFETKNEQEAKETHPKLVSFWRSKLLQYLLTKVAHTYTLTPSMFEYLPEPDYSQLWTDEEIYKRYRLSDSEIDIVEEAYSLIPRKSKVKAKKDERPFVE